MKLKHRLLSLLSAAALSLSLLPALPASAADSDLYCTVYSGSDIGKHEYGRWTQPITSYLVPSGTGWMRVQSGAIKATETANQQALIEYYSSDSSCNREKQSPCSCRSGAGSMPARTDTTI